MPTKPEGADGEDINDEDANDEDGEGRSREDPDPIIKLLPILTQLHSLLQECKFPAFWALYRSDELTTLRENYTVECVGFEDSIRDVVVRAVRAAFKRIGVDRLGLYLDLTGAHSCRSLLETLRLTDLTADDLPEYVSKLGWTFDSAANAVTIPPNPDNHVEATVVRENIQLQRKSP
jgi:translation initiation factor 3 subunit K